MTGGEGFYCGAAPGFGVDSPVLSLEIRTSVSDLGKSVSSGIIRVTEEEEEGFGFSQRRVGRISSEMDGS